MVVISTITIHIKSLEWGFAYRKFSVIFFISLWNYLSYQCPSIWRSSTESLSHRKSLLIPWMSLACRRAKWDMCTFIKASWAILIICPSLISIENHSLFVVEESLVHTWLVAVGGEHGFRPPRSFLNNDSNTGKSPRVSSYQHFSPKMCVPLGWSSPSILPLWFSEVNICNPETVPSISLRASETTGCCWTAPTLECRTVAAFAWARWAEFM